MYINGFNQFGLWNSKPIKLKLQDVPQFGGLGLRRPYPGLTVYVSESYHEVKAWTEGIKIGLNGKV